MTFNNLNSTHDNSTEQMYLGDCIRIKGAKTHNLKNIDLEIPKNKLTVITGLSGSGKSSLAFDTLYAEGQRRYVESLSSYARQFLQMMEKPDVDSIDGLSPAISIEQKATSHNPRSTVGTVTEIHDYFRIFFARCGDVYCPDHQTILKPQTQEQIINTLCMLADKTKIAILAPLVDEKKGENSDLFKQLIAQGFSKIRLNKKIQDLDIDLKLEKNTKNTIELVIDRLIFTEDKRQRLVESVELAFKYGNQQLIIHFLDEDRDEFFSTLQACPECNWSAPKLEPRMFSFNSPLGACPSCEGLGLCQFFDPNKIIPDPSLSIAAGAILGWGKLNGFYYSILEDLSRHFKFSMTTAWNELDASTQNLILYGTGKQKIMFTGPSRFYSTGREQIFEGVLANYERRFKDQSNVHYKEEWQAYISTKHCPQCLGSRLNKVSQNVKIGNQETFSLQQLNNLPIKQLLNTLKNLKIDSQRTDIAQKILFEITQRLQFLDDVGLHYLSLNRSADTLSGGEAQRIRLASQIGSGLTGVMYVLDEPSIGLHQKDNDRLINTMRKLRNLGNTVIVVEHDQDVIKAADYIIDIGPGAGIHGGYIIAQGTPESIQKNTKSITAPYVFGGAQIPFHTHYRDPYAPNRNFLTITGATGNNLKNVNLQIPIGCFTSVCGVSGSGKSSLINETLYKILAKHYHRSTQEGFPYQSVQGLEHLDKVISIDQSPIGRTPRSNPATYTGLFTPIRELFAQLPLAKERGYDPGRFSFNVKGGRCEKCQGDGVLKIEMHFLPDVYVNCETCQGKRYNKETLEILFKGYSISQILDMTVEESLELFKSIPKIHKKIQTLQDVGLGYIRLGQSATTLSGGEAQRVKLSLELSKTHTGKTIYILDEPTTGLHFKDIELLLNILHKLVDNGNTVVVIEHNLDVIKTSDYIIDMGPDGGAGGGEIMVAGNISEIINDKNSITAPYLKPYVSEAILNQRKKNKYTCKKQKNR